MWTILPLEKYQGAKLLRCLLLLLTMLTHLIVKGDQHVNAQERYYSLEDVVKCRKCLDVFQKEQKLKK